MTIKELADKLKVSEKNNQKRFRKTQKKNIIKRVGKKGGYWEIIQKK